MKTFRTLTLAAILALPVLAQESLDAALEKAQAEYTGRLKQAAAELTAAREKIAREKAPLLQAQRQAEDRLLAAESTLNRLKTLEAQSADNRIQLGKEAATLHKNSAYVNTLAQDSLRAYADTLAPGEEQALAGKLTEVQAAFDSPERVVGAQAGVEAAEFLLGRITRSVGGYTAEGQAMIGEGNGVHEGTFAYAGPQTFFRSTRGDAAGVVVRLRESATHPTVYLLKQWPAAEAAALFQGGLGNMPADATGNKALRLKQTTGTALEHIHKGGNVAYAILLVGALSLLLILQKLYDVARLAVDEPAAAQAFLTRLAAGGRAQAEAALGPLRATTRELFATGLQHLDEPKAALEERLQAFLLKQRLHYERRLPLLAVIATAAPLMGLLGTVVGMVKTFALITVFGTGNAGKLASGISEVLVATELGLAVAIPTLVIHGFLAQRIHKCLAALERHALEFVTTAKSAGVKEGAA